MKKGIRIAVVCLLLAVLANMLLPAVYAQEPITGISINQTKNLAVGDSKILIVTAEPAGSVLPELVWSSSNESVATVSDTGVVTGIKAGLVTVTAKAKDDDRISASVDLVVRSAYSYKVDWSGTFNQTSNNQTTTAQLPLDPGSVQKIWQADVGNSTVAIVDDYIYTYNGTDPSGAMDKGGTFYKIHKETGEIMDSMKCNASCGYYYSYTIYGGGLIYVSCVGTVMAFDPDSFTLLWTAQTPDTNLYPTVQFVNDYVVTGGKVFNSTTGETVKTLPGSYVGSSGVERNGLFYLPSNEGILYAFDTSTWEEKDSLKFRTTTSSMQPGAAYFGGNLYWGEASGGNAYSVRTGTDGSFADTSLIKTACSISTSCAPVANNGRVYLAGSKDGEGVVGVFRSSDLSLVYIAGGAREKISSTPVLRSVDADAPVISSTQAAGIAAQQPQDGNYVFVQDYGSPSKIYVLQDIEASTTDGSLTELFQVEPAEYAYEQFAFDKEGALYVTNDAGCLVKYMAVCVEAPVFTQDLTQEELRYTKGDIPKALEVKAVVEDGGSLSYQWQKRTENGDWKDISGANTFSYIPDTAAAATTYYRCVATNTVMGVTASANSRAVKIIVTGAAEDLVYGDVNEDGSINTKDVTFLKRYIAKWPDITVNEANCDVNADGSINTKDVTILKRFIAKWPDVTLGPN